MARTPRKDMSFAEILLWQRLRSRPSGLEFRRQHPIGPYVTGFFCRESKLVVEVAGGAHCSGDRPARHEERERFIREHGYAVPHVSATELTRDAAAVADAIVAFAVRPLHRPADGPPPRSGEEPE